MSVKVKRINLSVPIELKKLMDQRQHVNWSRIAAAAFSEALKRTERDDIAEDMSVAWGILPQYHKAFRDDLERYAKAKDE